ncbi:LANO_0F08834g1_1 [Lachancea nothofagi CBS 11611]|uniref:Nitrogen permease regulator 3 n=1 Tax=Lachancea nothofagi CBS 11611 TaxID=1266666 RepID=A0A1G4K9P9_9SACH|nr:LANO_0F08834g1_1 [Lachancea nothofagi CBS 11611]
MYLNLPNPCLVGIVLTISTHSGPQVVYHYPPIDQLSSRRKTEGESSPYEKDQDAQDTGISVPSGSERTPTQRKRTQRSYHEAESDINVSIHSTRTDELESESSDSEDENTSSGLSDSDISTDYADVSSGYSSSGSDIDDVSPNSEEFTATRFSIDNSPSIQSQATSLKSNGRDLHTSSSRVFQYLSTDDNKRNSIVSKHTLGRELEMSWPNVAPMESDDDGELLYELDDQHFGSEFQAINKILRYDADFFAEVSSPPKDMCNTRFELSIDDLVLVGLPVHRNTDGYWRRSKKKKPGNRSKRSNSSLRNRNVSQSRAGSVDADPDSRVNLGSGILDAEESHGRDEYQDLEKSVNMFHLCFLMNPQLVEYNERVDDMYHYVVSRLSLILRYAQSKTEFVTKECYEILKTRDHVLKVSEKYKSIKGQSSKGKYLYQRILQKSALARAITQCYDAISRNEVANLDIDDNKIISLQIPLKDEFLVLPDLITNPVLKGSFLTSILNQKFLKDSSGTGNEPWEKDIDDDDDLLDYALLLLHEPANIMQQLQYSSFRDDVTSVILSSLVKNLKPTVPLRNYQFIIDEVMGASDLDDGGRKNSFQTGMLRSLALHLMYWRHARIIIPISSKSTYIVSPLAPVTGCAKDDFAGNRSNVTENKPLIFQNQDIFAKKFPPLPPLPSFLSLVSSSKPRPFGNLIPSKDHKNVYLNALSWLIRYGYLTQLLTFVRLRVDSRIKIAVDEDLEVDGVRRPKNSKYRNLNTDTSDNVITPGLPDDLEDDLDFFYYGDDEDIVNRADFTIILNPERATAVEKRWLYKCVEGQPSDVQVLFHKLVKYFNGTTPIELVQIREGVSRHEIRKLFQALGKYLVETKHW